MKHEGPIGEGASYYVQAGASVVTPDGGDVDTVLSGKAGLGIALSDALGAYGEVSFHSLVTPVSIVDTEPNWV